MDVATFWDDERHYQLFSVLADVRNGYGFAGVPTGEWVKPISSPRGIPQDFEYYCWEHPLSPDCLVPRRRGWWEADHPMDVISMDPDGMTMLSGDRWDDETITLHQCAVWMGEHSFSWLTGEELLNWYKNAPTVVKVGLISKQMYEEWDKITPPTSYWGGVWGGGSRVINESEVGKVSFPWTDVRVTWEQSLRDELAYFFIEVQRLVDKHGKIRMVFGFDS